MRFKNEESMCFVSETTDDGQRVNDKETTKCVNEAP